MNNPATTQETLIQRSIEAFWQTFPSTWRSIHTYTHNIAVERYHITMAQFIILREINFGDTSVSQLAEAGHISRPAISRLVDILVNKQLVNRVENPVDRRHVSLSLTTQGERLLAELFKDTHLWMETKLKTLSDQELKKLIQSLELLRKTFVE
jgi:DNA-binding MarR family transcriptional regulator